jgi:hypothetical protein
VLPGLPSNKKNSSDHHNSYNKGPNLAFFSFIESPSNSLPTIKFPKNHITSSYYSNMPKTAKAKIWPLRTLGIKPRVHQKFEIFWTNIASTMAYPNSKNGPKNGLRALEVKLPLFLVCIFTIIKLEIVEIILIGKCKRIPTY